jgi:hypothetical protein
MSKDSNWVNRLPDAFGLSFQQAEVDFVIPDLAVDIPLCIDPFLLYKSRDDRLRELHGQLVSLFNQGVQFYREGKRSDLNRLIDFPEVNAIGFGYSQGQVRGSGLGEQINGLLADTLAGSEALQERGLRHVEELQLVSIGVGADRVSDIAANILKTFLIEYTQEQCRLWRIPITASMPVEHYFDFEDWDWADGYFDLPRNPINGGPVLLVPRRIVRLLPWINYEDYAKTDFAMYLQPANGRRFPRYPGMPQQQRKELSKREVVNVTRTELTLLDSYITRKERESRQAEPALGGAKGSLEAEQQVGNDLVLRLNGLAAGQGDATEFQRVVYAILNYLFEPELTGGELEVQSYLGTERRDIVYMNEAEVSFWNYVRTTYGSPLVMFEVKNVEELKLDHVNQAATYLGARLGMLGFIVTRNPAGDNIIRKTYSIYNDTPSIPRKVLLILADEDLIAMIRLKQEEQNPGKYVQRLYRSFRQLVQ